jgi:hypothetical protein
MNRCGRAFVYAHVRTSDNLTTNEVILARSCVEPSRSLSYPLKNRPFTSCPMTPETVVDVLGGSDTNRKFAAGSSTLQATVALLSRNFPPKPVVGLLEFGNRVGAPVAFHLTSKDTVPGIGGIGGMASPNEFPMFE